MMKGNYLLVLGTVGLGIIAFLASWPDSAPTPVAGPASSPDEKVKYGMIDLSEVIRKSYLHQAVEEEVEIEMASIKKEDLARHERIKELEQELHNLMNKVDDPSLSLAIREAARKASQMKEADVQALKKEREDFLETSNDNLARKEKALQDEVTRKIRDCVQKHAKARELDFVFDVSGSSETNNFAAASDRPVLDLTEAVLEILNKNVREPEESDHSPKGERPKKQGQENSPK